MNYLVNILIWCAYFVSLYFSVFLLLVYLDKKKIFLAEKSSLYPKYLPLVSVLIPAYNEEKNILKTLESVDQIDYPKEKLEIIVIDDGSSDSTFKIMQEFAHNKANFKIISHKNMGKAASLNQALLIAKGEFFACLDADSFVDRLTLRKMISLYYNEDDSRLVIITPAMKVYNPENILQKVQWLEYLVIILFSRIASHIDSLYVAPGPFSLYKTDIIKKIGGFDEQNITEDQEIAYRLQKNHYKIKQCFDGYVYTVAPKRIKPFYKQRRRWYLGSLNCLNKYRNIIGNKKYGDFGMMQTMKNFIGYLLAFIGIFLAVYFVVIPLIETISNLIAIRFKIMPYLKNISFNFDWLTFLSNDFRLGFIIALLLAIGYFFFYQAHKNANEKMTKMGIIPLIPYFFFYYMLKGVILVVSLFHFSKGRKIKW